MTTKDKALILQKAIQAHEKGQLDQAKDLYAQALALDDTNLQALHGLAVLMIQTNHLPKANELLHRILELDPGLAQAHYHLGHVHFLSGKLQQAKASFEKALEINPNHSEAHNNLGVLLREFGKLEEASKHFYRAIDLDPHNISALNNLGTALSKLGQDHEAALAFKRAIDLEPSYFEANKNLGNLLKDMGYTQDAITYLEKAQRLSSQNKETLFVLATLYKKKGRLEEAVQTLKKILAFDQQDPLIFNYLGLILTEQGMIKQALENYQQALRLEPSSLVIHSNMLLVTNYFPGSNAQLLMQAHQDWYELHGAHLYQENYYSFVQVDPEKRLRIGYISPDFRSHPVGNFFLPLICSHDKNQVEIFCYSDVEQAAEDQVTQEIKAYADHWRNIFNQPVRNVAELIRNDAIDILVDLAGHTGRNRLPVFCIKPAPVQITWLGYPNTTGLATMDYRITDPIADPPGITDKLSSEKLIRLENGFLCFDPLVAAPEVGPLPAQAQGAVTFASFNNLAKVHELVIETWSKILARLPQARLFLKSPTLSDPLTRKRFKEQFQRAKVNPAQVKILDFAPTRAQHLGTYNQVDIALDPFPYNGTTTSCEAMYMGVPIITLLGDRHCGRVGASLLHRVGLPELIAKDLEEYVEFAVNLSHDLVGLQKIRKNIRSMMLNSPLCDRQGFARTMEQTYRTAWRKWCQEQTNKKGADNGPQNR